MTPEKLYLAVYVPYNPLYQIWLRYLVYFSFQSAKNRFRDARTPQPVEIVFNTMTYRSSETVQRPEYFQRSVTYIKVQIMFK